MRKEFGWAIGIGIFFGLIIAFGIWRVNSIVNIKPSDLNPKASPTPIAKSPSQISLVINTPENGDVIGDTSVKVSGLTKSNAMVLVSGEDSDYMTNATSSGLFEQDVDLSSGINQISAFSFDNDKQSSSNVLVIYSSFFSQKQASSSASVDDQVNAQLNNIANKPKSYIGTVTDVTDSTIQIKTESNEIKQVAVGNLTTVVNTKDKTSKSAKLTDIAIGDFIAALGNINKSSVLSADRILITDPITPPTIKAIVAKYDKTEIQTDKNTVFYQFKDGDVTKIKSTSIKTGADIIYTQADKVVRTVFVIPS